MIKKILKTEAEWKKILTPEQYDVMRNRGTEAPFSCQWENLGEGAYHCAACDLELFKSRQKFDSGTGWPSYFEPLTPDHIEQVVDNSHGMSRVEVRCARCESHLGHVFDDGPPPTGKRYCINSIALRFEPAGRDEIQAARSEIAVFGGGCFWCFEPIFSSLRGVHSVVVGYAGGKPPIGGKHPTYEEVCTGKSGHAEIVRVEFDPRSISYTDLLEVFFAVHDPTTLNRQGHDVGSQYRSIILYASDQQKTEAKKFIKKLSDEKMHGTPIVTEIKSLKEFWPAEEYHQHYFEKNPTQAYCQLSVGPKIGKMRDKFKHLLK